MAITLSVPGSFVLLVNVKGKEKYIRKDFSLFHKYTNNISNAKRFSSEREARLFIRSCKVVGIWYKSCYEVRNPVMSRYSKNERQTKIVFDAGCQVEFIDGTKGIVVNSYKKKSEKHVLIGTENKKFVHLSDCGNGVLFDYVEGILPYSEVFFKVGNTYVYDYDINKKKNK